MFSSKQLTAATLVALLVALSAIVVASQVPPASVAVAVSTTHHDLGIDRRAALIDELVDLAVIEAQRWNRDAVMLALAADNVRADGTVDLEAGRDVTVWVVSPSRVRSLSAVRRLEAIRVYRFTADGLRVDPARSGLGEGWDAWEPPPRARCRVSDLARRLKREKLSISAERQPSAVTPHDWRVRSADPDVSGLYRMTDCVKRAILETW
jgi:hypothetical protein